MRETHTPVKSHFRAREKRSRRVFLGFLFAASAAPVFAGGTSDTKRTYKTGYSSIMKLGRDIHAALDAEHREKIAPQPISIETDERPFARLLFLKDGDETVRGVWISAGFIDLVNHLAHAKAISSKEKNYFRNYAAGLEQEIGVQRELPNIAEARYWIEEILNEQQSNFNSIVGMIVGMKLANHYLGHYDRYAPKLEAGMAINNLLSREEWNEAFTHGVRNAVRAGCMTEGVAPFLEALDGMKVRPAWAADFLPDNVKFSSMRKEMEAIQRRSLEGKE